MAGAGVGVPLESSGTVLGAAATAAGAVTRRPDFVRIREAASVLATREADALALLLRVPLLHWVTVFGLDPALAAALLVVLDGNEFLTHGLLVTSSGPLAQDDVVDADSRRCTLQHVRRTTAAAAARDADAAGIHCDVRIMRGERVL